MTPKKRMNSLLLKQTYEMIVWGGGNKRLLSKRKIRWYTIAMKVLLFSSFEKQKEYKATAITSLLDLSIKAV